MKVQEIRDLTLEDLKARISDTRKELVDMRFQHALRKLESTAKLKSTRRTLSRMLTIEAEMLKGESKPVAAKSEPKKEAPKKEAKEKEEKVTEEKSE